jgi:transposase-like protein
VPISDLCDEFGIAPNLFYRWQRELSENGHTVFEGERKGKAVENAKDRKIEFLEGKLQRKNEVLSPPPTDTGTETRNPYPPPPTPPVQ